MGNVDFILWLYLTVKTQKRSEKNSKMALTNAFFVLYHLDEGLYKALREQITEAFGVCNLMWHYREL